MNLELKMARIKKQYTQKRLGEAVGVTSKYISLLETSNILPSGGLMKKIAIALEKPVQELFFNEDEKL